MEKSPIISASPSYLNFFDANGDVKLREGTKTQEEGESKNHDQQQQQEQEEEEASRIAERHRQEVVTSYVEYVENDQLLVATAAPTCSHNITTGTADCNSRHHTYSSGERPSSSYRKKRSALEDVSGAATPQLNLSPDSNSYLPHSNPAPVRTTIDGDNFEGREHRQDHKEVTGQTTIHTVDNRGRDHDHSIMSMDQLVTPPRREKSTTHPSVGMKQSFFMPEMPPAPQIKHDVIDDQNRISQLSLQPEILGGVTSTNSSNAHHGVKSAYYLNDIPAMAQSHSDSHGRTAAAAANTAANSRSKSAATTPHSKFVLHSKPVQVSSSIAPPVSGFRLKPSIQPSLIFSSLPLDALHSIAGFLTVKEWCNVGMLSKEGHHACKEVFRKIKMHGFKCAVEVASAWEHGVHSDAKELAALYVKTGVPIYPAPLGHSYHTLIWRMKMEVKEITTEENGESAEGNNDPQRQLLPNEPARPTTVTNASSHNNTNNRDSSASTIDDTTPKIDRFFIERVDLRNIEFSTKMTYLEEKGIFWRDVYSAKNGVTNELARNVSPIPTHRENLHRAHPPPPPVRFNIFHDDDDDDDDNEELNHIMEHGRIMGIGGDNANALLEPPLPPHFPPANGHDEPGNNNHQLRQQPIEFAHIEHIDPFPQLVRRRSRSPRHSQSIIRRTRNKGLASTTSSALSSSIRNLQRTIPVTCHKHLVNQHIQRLSAVDDESGRMGSSSMNLSVDFFHPYHSSTFDQHSHHSAAAVANPILEPVISRRSRENAVSPYYEHPVISSLDLKVYSFDTESVRTMKLKQNSEKNEDKINSSSSRKGAGEVMMDLVHRYEKELEHLLKCGDYDAFDECLLDFWDEFFPVTALVHFYDNHTPVPRASHMQEFVSRPCPKAFGTVQCEIERIKVYHKSKGVNVTRRLFPTYEYRLFIRDRRNHLDNPNQGEETQPRIDTLFMIAKNKGRNFTSSSMFSTTSGNKRGVNNYHIYLPDQNDIENHFAGVNDSLEQSNASTGYRQKQVSASRVELGRLQSNFIGTEFEIFSRSSSPSSGNKSSCASNMSEDNTTNSHDPASHDRCDSSTRKISKSLMCFSKSLKRQGNDTDSSHHVNTNQALDNRNRKGRIIPWSSFSKKNITRRTEDAYQIPEYETIDHEIGAITYTANLLGNRPRVMDVCIPRIHSVNGQSVRNQVDGDASDDVSMLNKLKSLSQVTEDETDSTLDNLGLMSLQNRPPWWNVELNAFVLNFGGRVRVASVKNFQLCERNNHENIMLQFGRIEGRHSFTMDLSYPLSPVQAFAVAISSLQSKISFA